MNVKSIILSFGFQSFIFLSVRSQCVDKPHYYYKCSQLAKYCNYPQATRIRKSCPVTCGICEETNGFRRTITFDSSQNGIIQPLPTLSDMHGMELNSSQNGIIQPIHTLPDLHGVELNSSQNGIIKSVTPIVNRELFPAITFRPTPRPRMLAAAGVSVQVSVPRKVADSATFRPTEKTPVPQLSKFPSEGLLGLPFSDHRFSEFGLFSERQRFPGKT